MRRVVSSKGVEKPEFQLKESTSRQSLMISKNLINIEDEEDKSVDGLPKMEALGSAKGSDKIKWFLSSPIKGSVTTRIEQKQLSHSSNKNEFKKTQTEDNKLVNSSLGFFNRNSSEPNFETFGSSFRNQTESETEELRHTQSYVKLTSGNHSKKPSMDDEEERISNKKSANAAKRKILIKANSARLEVLKSAFSVMKNLYLKALRKNQEKHKSMPVSLHKPIMAESIPNFEESEEAQDQGEGSFIENVSNRSSIDREKGTKIENIPINMKVNPYYFHSIVEEQQNSNDNLPSVNKKSSRGKITPSKLKAKQGNDPEEYREQQKDSPLSTGSRRERNENQRSSKGLKPSLSLEYHAEKFFLLHRATVPLIEKKKEGSRILDNLEDVSSVELGPKNDIELHSTERKRDPLPSSILNKSLLNMEELSKAPKFINKIDFTSLQSKTSSKEKFNMEEQLFDSFVLNQKMSLEQKISKGSKKEILKQFSEDKITDILPHLKEKRRVPRKDYKEGISSKSYMKVIGGLAEINSISKVGHSVKDSTGLPEGTNKTQNQQYFLHVIHNMFSRNSRRWQRTAFSQLAEDESARAVLPLQIFVRPHVGLNVSRSSYNSRSPETSLMGTDSVWSGAHSQAWRFDAAEVYNVKFLDKSLQWLVYARKRAAFKFLKKVVGRSKSVQHAVYAVKDVVERNKKMRVNVAFHMIQNKSKGTEWELQIKNSQLERLRILVEKVLNPKLDDLTVGFIKIDNNAQSKIINFSQKKRRTAEYRFLLKILFGIQHGHIRFGLFQLKSWADFVGGMKQLGKNHQLKSLVESTQRKVAEIMTTQKKEAKIKIKEITSQMGLRTIFSIIVRQLTKKARIAFVKLSKEVQVLANQAQIEESDGTEMRRQSVISKLLRTLLGAFTSKRILAFFTLQRNGLSHKLHDQSRTAISSSLLMLESILTSSRKQRSAIVLTKLRQLTFFRERVALQLHRLSYNQSSKLRATLTSLRHFSTQSRLLSSTSAHRLCRLLTTCHTRTTVHAFSVLRHASQTRSTILHRLFATLATCHARRASATLRILHAHEARLRAEVTLELANQKLATAELEAAEREKKTRAEFLVMEKMMEEEQKMLEDLVKAKARLEAEVSRLQSSQAEVDEDKDERIENLEEEVKTMTEKLEKLEVELKTKEETYKEEVEKSNLEKSEIENIKDQKDQEIEELKKQVEIFNEEKSKNDDEKEKLLAAMKEEELKVTKEKERLEILQKELDSDRTKLFASIKEQEMDLLKQKDAVHEEKSKLEAERTKMLASIKETELKLIKKEESLIEEAEKFEIEKDKKLEEIRNAEKEVDTQRDLINNDQASFENEKSNMLASLKEAELKLEKEREKLLSEHSQFETIKNQMLASLKEGEIELAKQREVLKGEQNKLEVERSEFLISIKEEDIKREDQKKLLEQDYEKLAAEKSHLFSTLKESENELIKDKELLREEQSKFEDEKLKMLASIKQKEFDNQKLLAQLEEEKSKFEDEKTKALSLLKDTELELAAAKNTLLEERSEFESEKSQKLSSLKAGEELLLGQRSAFLAEQQQAESARTRSLAQLKDGELLVQRQQAELHAEMLRVEAERQARELELRTREIRAAEMAAMAEAEMLRVEALEVSGNQEVSRKEARVEAMRESVEVMARKVEVDREAMMAHVKERELEVRSQQEELKSDREAVEGEWAQAKKEREDAEAEAGKIRAALVEEQTGFEATKNKMLVALKEGELEVVRQRELIAEEKDKIELERNGFLAKIKEAEIEISKQKGALLLERSSIEIQRSNMLAEIRDRELEMTKEKELYINAKENIEYERIKMLSSIREEELALTKQKEDLQLEKTKLENDRMKMLAAIKEKEIDVEKQMELIALEKSQIQEEKTTILANIKEGELELTREKEIIKGEYLKLEQERTLRLATIKEGELALDRQKEALEAERLTIDDERIKKLAAVKDAELEVARQNQMVIEERSNLALEKTRILASVKDSELEVAREKELLKEEKVKMEAERQELLASIKESEIDLKNQKETLKQEYARIEEEKAKMLSAIKENESLLSKQIEAILDENIKSVGQSQGQKPPEPATHLQTAPSFSKLQESTQLAFDNMGQADPTASQRTSQFANHDFFRSASPGDYTFDPQEVRKSRSGSRTPDRAEHLATSSALLLAKLFAAKHAVARHAFCEVVKTGLAFAGHAKAAAHGETNLTASFHERIPDPWEAHRASRQNKPLIVTSNEDFDDLRIVERKLTPTNSIRTTKKYDFGKNKESEPAESRNLSIYSDKEYVSREFRETSNLSELTGAQGDFKYPSMVFEKVHQRIKEINDKLDRSQNSKLMINTEQFFLPKNFAPTSNGSLKSPLAFEMGKRSSIPSVSYYSKLGSPTSSHKKYSIIDEALSPSTKDYREPGTLERYSQDLFSRKQNKLRHENMAHKLATAGLPSKFTADLADNRVDKLRSTLNPRSSIKSRATNFFFGKLGAHLKPRTADKRAVVLSRVLNRLTAKRARQALEHLNRSMLASIAEEVPRHAKPVRLMAIAGSLHRLFTERKAQALSAIDSHFVRAVLESRPSQQQFVKVEVDLSKLGPSLKAGAALGSERRKEARSHLDRLLDEARLHGLDSLYAETHEGNRKMMEIKTSSQYRGGRDFESKSLEYEIGVISRLRSFQKIEFFTRSLENLLKIKYFKKLALNTRDL